MKELVERIAKALVDRPGDLELRVARSDPGKGIPGKGSESRAGRRSPFEPLSAPAA
jgi:predicted RNA-binding protein YlqC (UPF0109 family)